MSNGADGTREAPCLDDAELFGEHLDEAAQRPLASMADLWRAARSAGVRPSRLVEHALLRLADSVDQLDLQRSRDAEVIGRLKHG